jgi:hypothetical protein
MGSTADVQSIVLPISIEPVNELHEEGKRSIEHSRSRTELFEGHSRLINPIKWARALKEAIYFGDGVDNILSA